MGDMWCGVLAFLYLYSDFTKFHVLGTLSEIARCRLHVAAAKTSPNLLCLIFYI